MDLSKYSFMTPPPVVPEDQITKTITDDIIVIGAGMSGLTTAYSAQQSGGSVTLISGSNSPVSRGGSNFAANSKVMESLGVKPFDPVKFFYNEYRTSSFQVDQQKWMRGYNASEEAMNWIIDTVREDGLDVVLERDNTFDGGPYYAHAFNTLNKSDMVSTGQQGAVESIARHAEALGTKLIYNMVAKYLERENNNTGRVTSVIAQDEDGNYLRFVGRKAIVLATGDFSANYEMLEAFCPRALEVLPPEEKEVSYSDRFAFGGVYKGDGQKMGLWIGAAWQHVWPNAYQIQGKWGGSHEPIAFHMGLNINTRGERFQREDFSAPFSAAALLLQPGKKAFGIWTANFAQDLIDRGHEWYRFGADFTKPAKTPEEMIELWDNTPKAYVKADTLEELAEKLEVPADKLKATVARYNELCEKQVDEDFHKNPDFLIKIDPAGPFYAATNTPMLLSVFGGLRTNAQLAVCDENDDPIPGLYNVGCMVGDMYANAYSFAIPGQSYGINCMTFGYLLGKDLARL